MLLRRTSVNFNPYLLYSPLTYFFPSSSNGNVGVQPQALAAPWSPPDRTWGGGSNVPASDQLDVNNVNPVYDPHGTYQPGDNPAYDPYSSNQHGADDAYYPRTSDHLGDNPAYNPQGSYQPDYNPANNPQSSNHFGDNPAYDPESSDQPVFTITRSEAELKNEEKTRPGPPSYNDAVNMRGVNLNQ